MSSTNNNPDTILNLIKNANTTNNSLAQTPPEVAFNFHLNAHEARENAGPEVKKIIAVFRAKPELLTQLTPREMDHGLNTVRTLMHTGGSLARILDASFSQEVSEALKQEIALTQDINKTQLSDSINKFRQTTISVPNIENIIKPKI